MTDVTNNTEPATATTVNTPTAPSSAATNTKVAAKLETSKPKNKTKRRPQRRRAAVSDNDSSANEDGNQSDSSASSHSDPADSEEDEPESAVKAKLLSVFPDVSSITPAGWKKEDNATEAISFEDFEAGKESPAVPARGTGLAIRGRGKGKPEAGQKREYTPEETAKYEAQKAKRKEKQRVKKAELREKATKDREAKGKDAPAVSADKPTAEPPITDKPAPAPSSKPSAPVVQPAKAKGKKKAEPTPAAINQVAEVTASTSALKLDDPAPEATTVTETAPSATEITASPPKSKRGVELLPHKPASNEPVRPQRGPQGNQREAFTQRAAEDPKVTPRVGQFWTHDQRLHEGGNVDGSANGARQMPFWQGRGMPRGGFRGGFRGRGRGFFPNGPHANGRGGFVNGGPPRPVELAQEEPASKENEESGSMLAMDREFALAEAREKKSRTTQVVSPPAPAADVEAGATASAPAVRPPTAPLAERKWGHEAYETMGNMEQFRGIRGRGRGMRARGGFYPRIQHLPFHPSAIAAQNAAAAKAAAAAGLTPPTTAQPKVSTGPSATPQSAAPAQVATSQAAAPTPVAESAPSETVATQPNAESLLDTTQESLKVKFPGSEGTVIPTPTTVAAPVKPAVADSESVAPTSVAKEVSHEAQYPTLHSSSPGPVAAFQAQMYTGGSSNSPFPGSENGSVGSGHFARQQPNGHGHGQGQFYAPGMNSSGEFVPSSMQPQQQRSQFRPPMPHSYSPHSQSQQPSYSPGPYGHSHGHGNGSPQAGPSYVNNGPPMGSPQFFPGGNGYANGRSSPLNPYMNNGNQVGGYFSPARSASKVNIRAPRQEGESSQSHQSNGNDNGQQQQQQQGTYYPQHYNPYVQPFVPGQNQNQNQGQQHRQETVYYPTPNDQQYGWQGQGQYGEQGYYDANGAYGY